MQASVTFPESRALALRALSVLGLAVTAGCGPEPPPTPARFALRGRWEDPSALVYRLDAQDSPFEADLVRRMLEQACARWSEVAPVGFRPAREGELSDLDVSFERGRHGSCMPFGVDGSVAHSGPVGTGTFVHLDLDRSWVASGPGDAQAPALEQTLLHELGHVLGLDHSSDPDALMYADPHTTQIERSDVAGIRTLYDRSPPGPGDLAVTRGAETLAVLRGLAVPGAVEFELFDTDGDGHDELVLWRTDPAGHGELTSFFFDERCRPYRTLGPRAGMTGPGAATALVVTAARERLLVLAYPNGNRVARLFDGRGILQDYEGDPPALVQSARRLTGDLDGDGSEERVRAD